MILGQFKTCVILLGGYLLFSSDPGFISIAGAVVALGGMSVYTSLSMNETSQEKVSGQVPNQNMPPAKSKTGGENNEEKKPESQNLLAAV